ncbi:MAG: coenzyme F420-0:L-glutamate ligase [Gammaproteobacteria bacterium]|nr:MAG: coenzyme F420-0:L-glutamate ligase [Gammaproteobacteria bacterium]
MQLIGITGLPMVKAGDDVAALIADALQANNLRLQAGDILVVAQKIISKSENRFRVLDDVVISDAARTLAEEVGKDPRLIQLILDESVRVVRKRKGVVIVEHTLGFVQANAGIDQSNVETVNGKAQALLLPENPDASAAQLRSALRERCGVAPGVIINDSTGRPWRNGITSFAIGVSGFKPVQDCIGRKDLFGRALEVTQVAVADELACAASTVMGQANESIPVVLVRGVSLPVDEQASGRELVRPAHEDLFR